MKKPILKRLMSLALTLIMVFSMGMTLAACGNQDDGKIHITFYTTQGEKLRAVTQRYAAQFEEMYPNVKVDGLDATIGSYDDVRNQVSTELMALEGPDIAYCYPDHVALYNISKSVQTLDEYIDSTDMVTAIINGEEKQVPVGMTEAEKADFIEGYWNEGKQFGDGLMYTLPFSKSTEVLYFNKTFFDAHKDVIEVPTHWWCDGYGCGADCKASMEYVCKKILEIDPNCIPLGYDSESNWFITMCEQLQTPYTSATGTHFLFDNDDNKAFVKRFLGWYAKGYFTTQEINGGYTSDRFVAQKSYMCIGSSAGASHQIPEMDGDNYKFVADIASIPQQDKDNNKVISQGPSVCLLKNGSKEEILYSWLFIKFLTTSTAFQADFSIASGYVPVLKSVNDDPTYIAEMAQANGTYGLPQLSTKRCLEQADAYYASPAFYGSSDARDQVGALLQTVFTTGYKLTDDAEINDIINSAFSRALTACRQAVNHD